MLRLPAALVEDISLRSAALHSLSLTCTALWRVLNQPEPQLRFYLEQRRRRHRHHHLLTNSSSTSSSNHSPDSAAAAAAAPFGPSTVYELLCCRAGPRDAQGALRLLQLLLACSSMVQLVPDAQQGAVQHALAATSSSRDGGPEASAVLMTVLPHAEHCLLHFCAASGHLQLVKLLLPRSTAPVRLHGVLHYVKSGAFLAAAAGGHVSVLSELLAAGAHHWACQLPGSSLTSSALDLAATGGHLEAMKLLSHYVANPSPTFLTAAADSGSGVAMEWALQHWFAQFSAVTAFSKAHALQLHDALKVACFHGHVSAVRQLLATLHRITNDDDCCVLALTYASSTSNTHAIQAVLESPQLPEQLTRGGPKLLSKLAQAVASCMRIAILKHCRPALDTLLQSLASSSSPIAAARPLLAPQMRFIFDTTGQSGNGAALQLLLLMLPEHYEALGVSALEAALSEGHADVAATIKTLLLMQGPEQGFAAAALSPEGNPGLATASLHGAYKGACVRGDIPALQHLLQQAPLGLDDNMQLLLLRVAAGAGREAAVRLLLREFGGVGPRLEGNLKAVCRGAVHAGQLQLLQSLASDRPRSALLSHITSQPEALAEYLRAALLCGQVDVAAWLVLLAHQQQEMELVRSTLSSLLATSRWELLNAGRGIVMQDVVFDLLKRLAAHALAARGEGGGGSSSSSSTPGAAAAASVPAAAGAASAAAGAGAGSSAFHASLGHALLQPQLLGQLLHASHGRPWRLLTVVELVDWWGLGSSQAQQQQQQPPRQQQLSQQAVAAPVPMQAAGQVLQQPAAQQAVQQPVLQQPAVVQPAPAVEGQQHPMQQQQQQDRAVQQQQQQQGWADQQHQQARAAAASGAQTSAGVEAATCEPQQQQLRAQAQRQSSSDDSTALRDTAAPPRSSSGCSLTSNESGNANGRHGSGSSSSSSVTSAGSTGATGCDVVSPCVTQAGGSAAAKASPAAAGLVAANSMEVGSLQSDDCQHNSTWLDDLVNGPGQPGSSTAPAPAPAPACSLQPPQPQQRQQQQQEQMHLHVQQPSTPTQHKQLDLGKEWGGSWQQLTGQVALLHMTSPDARHPHHQHPQQQQQQQQEDPARRPRCSFDYEQHLAQQMRRQRQGANGPQLRRGSSPGRYTTAVAAARQLRNALSQPGTHAPVHPYMQPAGQQQQQQQQALKQQQPQQESA